MFTISNIGKKKEDALLTAIQRGFILVRTPYGTTTTINLAPVERVIVCRVYTVDAKVSRFVRSKRA
jgi:hypothetical protein